MCAMSSEPLTDYVCRYNNLVYIIVLHVSTSCSTSSALLYQFLITFYSALSVDTHFTIDASNEHKLHLSAILITDNNKHDYT